ncbi:MAG: hypothetical protein EA401_05645 [Planctomycetota bacterium]|nr:MAG: hypothetical protein EA401_05645 [Planctomycetota bacterium]
MSPDDLCALASTHGQAALQRWAAEDPQRLALNAARSPQLPVRAIVEQLTLRQRYRQKFASWLPYLLLESQACEQAASQALARWKARNLLPAQSQSVVDCCAGLGSDIFAAAEAGHHTQAWEHNPLLASLLRHNAQALKLPLTVHQGDGCTDLAEAGTVLADPDRRASGRRSLQPSDWSPTPAAILAAAHNAACIILKLPPGADPSSIASPGHRQLIVLSQAGEAREQLLCIYPRQPATVLPARAVGLDYLGNLRFDVQGDANTAPPPPLSWQQPGPVFIDPDPALIRSGLIATCAQRHRLSLVHPQVAFLHGNDPGTDFPGSRFQVHDSGPWENKILRRRLRQMGLSRLRISRRHFPWTVESIHHRLGTREGGSMRLFCYRNGDEALAWTLAEPLLAEG